MTYKLLNADSSCQREHSKTLSQKRANTTVHNHYFSKRIIAHWSNLPDNAITAPSGDAFKIAINKSGSIRPLKTEWNAIEAIAPHHH
jgi:hypothetical protein